jgi:hypothetical protein
MSWRLESMGRHLFDGTEQGDVGRPDPKVSAGARAGYLWLLVRLIERRDDLPAHQKKISCETTECKPWDQLAGWLAGIRTCTGCGLKEGEWKLSTVVTHINEPRQK